MFGMSSPIHPLLCVSAQMTEEGIERLNEIAEFARGAAARLDEHGDRLEAMGQLSEEVDKVKTALEGILENERKAARSRVLSQGSLHRGISVLDGPFAGVQLVDLGMLRGIAEAHTVQASGEDKANAVRWMREIDAAKEELVPTIGPAEVAAFFERLEAKGREAYVPKTMPGFAPVAPERQWNEVIAPRLEDMRRDAMRAAMDSTTSGTGDELVATLERAELWMDVNLETRIAAIIPTFPMPSNPFDIPRQLGNIDFYPGTENIAGASTALGTGKTTLTAYELTGMVPFSFTLEEDSVLPSLAGEIRAGVVRNVAELLDDIILNADTTELNNINADGATITSGDAGKAHWLLGYDGLLHLPLVDNTSQGNDHNAAITNDVFNEIRSKLGKYGARPSELVWVMDVNTFIRAQSLSDFRTMDKLGPQATVLTGMLGAVEGIPVLVSEQMLLSEDADGLVTDGGNTTDAGRLLIVNRTQWAQGFRRQVTLDVTRDTQKRQTVLTVSLRHALAERSGTRSTATHTALQWGISGVA